MSLKGNIAFICGFCIILSVMASPDVATFFPEIKGNLSQVIWAHAVNNHSYLNTTLSDNKIMMIEADISLGIINGTNTTNIPIMAHPPNNVSDISLDTFLETINSFNVNGTNSTTRKGIKLDFKTIEVFNQSLDIVKKYDQGNYPLWLNADILAGPINATTTPVDAAQFLNGARQFNNTVLSIGYTTNYGANLTGSYSDDQVQSMLTTISQNNVTQQITFPLRAGLAAESLSQVRNLLNNVTNSTLTLWSSDGDNVNVTKLRTLIADVGVKKIYVDVPDDLRNQLRLDNLPGSASSFTSSILLFIFVSVMLALFK